MESSSVEALVTMMTMAELSKLGCVARMAAVRLDVHGFRMAMRGCAEPEGCPVMGGSNAASASVEEAWRSSPAERSGFRHLGSTRKGERMEMRRDQSPQRA